MNIREQHNVPPKTQENTQTTSNPLYRPLLTHRNERNKSALGAPPRVRVRLGFPLVLGFGLGLGLGFGLALWFGLALGLGFVSRGVP